MSARRLLIAVSARLLLGCAPAREPHDTAIEPAGLSVTALPGGNGVLEVIALTLRRGPSNSGLYATVKNVGAVPACDAALSVELFDHSEQSLAAGITGLLTQHFFRRTDGSDAIAACLGPGDVSVGAVLDLPGDLATEDVGHVIYRCPYFALDVESIDGLTVSGSMDAEGRYHGTLVNHLEATVENPSVTVFPVNRVARPLGMVSAGGDVEVAPGDSWDFETNSMDVQGFDSYAYPAGAFAE